MWSQPKLLSYLAYWSDLSFCLLLYRRRKQLPKKDCSSLFLVLSLFIPLPFHSHPSTALSLMYLVPQLSPAESTSADIYKQISNKKTEIT